MGLFQSKPSLNLNIFSYSSPKPADSNSVPNKQSIPPYLSPIVGFAIVSFCLGQLGDGLNIFQGIYLVSLGWNEGSVGIALSLMGLTALLVQTVAGDVVDRTVLDRRVFLVAASLVTAASASAILLVQEGNFQHGLMYSTKAIEGIASSFIAPCIAALTLASFGPTQFDAAMASNIFWGHVGSVTSAVLAGGVAYALYPNIKLCFLVIGASALVATFFVRFVPEGDALMGRGFKRGRMGAGDKQRQPQQQHSRELSRVISSEAAGYLSVFLDRKTVVLCLTGFFYHFANANVLLVLGELMGGENDDGSTKRSAIPLIAGAIVLAQATMSAATVAGDRLTDRGVGRKPLFLAGLVTLPVRCALILLWRERGAGYLLATQVMDGVGGGLFGLLHPYLVADLAFGSGRFNVVMGLTASCFGLGATMSNFLGQLVVEHFGHATSLTCSLVISFVPVVLFAAAMPETLGIRGHNNAPSNKPKEIGDRFVQMT